MSEEKTTTTPESAMLGEISTIRNILMGQQMSDYERRFEDLRNSLTNLSDENHRRLERFTNETEERFGSLERQIAERFDRLEKLMTDRLTQLDEKVDRLQREDKTMLSDLLVEMSQKLRPE